MTQLNDMQAAYFPGEETFSGTADEVRYVFHEGTAGTDAMVVGFSAVHRPDKTPRYSSIKILREMPCHRLFILDDRGPRTPLPRGCWYLGHRRSFTVAATVLELIDHVIAERGLDRSRVAACGSSKGGWAALYFAFKSGLGHVIAGEPQSLMGLHLLGPLRGPDTQRVAEYIAGGTSDEDREFLDGLLFDAIRASQAKPFLQLLVGRGGPYEKRHIEPLIACAREGGVPIEVEFGEFARHDDLAATFPPFLTRKVLALSEG